MRLSLPSLSANGVLALAGFVSVPAPPVIAVLPVSPVAESCVYVVVPVVAVPFSVVSIIDTSSFLPKSRPCATAPWVELIEVILDFLSLPFLRILLGYPAAFVAVLLEDPVIF